MTELQQRYPDERDNMKLSDIPTGSGVMKPSAIPMDFAYMRRGIVVRETTEDGLMCGVVWEGSNTAFQYPDCTRFDLIQGSTPQ